MIGWIVAGALAIAMLVVHFRRSPEHTDRPGGRRQEKYSSPDNVGGDQRLRWRREAIKTSGRLARLCEEIEAQGGNLADTAEALEILQDAQDQLSKLARLAAR